MEYLLSVIANSNICSNHSSLLLLDIKPDFVDPDDSTFFRIFFYSDLYQTRNPFQLRLYKFHLFFYNEVLQVFSSCYPLNELLSTELTFILSC